MAKYGYCVDAIDLSGDMLIIAKEKTHNLGLKINYLLQDMTNIKTNTKYECVTCINDGVNYLTNAEDVGKFLVSSSKCLKDDGYLLFDISTEHKMINMDGEMYAEEMEDMAYFWSNTYSKDTGMLTMDISFFIHENNDTYKKTTEIHTQRAHSVDEIITLLNSNGYKLLASYDELSKDNNSIDSDRVHFLCQKI